MELRAKVKNMTLESTPGRLSPPNGRTNGETRETANPAQSNYLSPFILLRKLSMTTQTPMARGRIIFKEFPKLFGLK